ncbi:leucine-rich repeat, immunoglobulin-like domain and transmembrane domain-containing protein 1 [Mercenaria mercenaria]|uniref:leucine-rich repeat, immunoglobulin-like domain and transmembrane domain-containing protein 1 n=1 Tax=Mercenaria mercenaria TaxID=6596 RepID=UPI00234E5B46|nr:leucine-rich repeat, immunoglobulin-like domain and transmembrane domain-containing protein 1 [Mercenaria mercenaria]XP_053404163.1 leucine-rich repeat, immunoglobulin-like domain and transmembrane domain-containing protein 1 [Mercenaria mercenaria]
MARLSFLTPSLVFAAVTMAIDPDIKTTDNNGVSAESPKDGDSICNLYTVEKKVILNCSGVTVQEEPLENLDQNVNVLDISYIGLTRLSVFSKEHKLKNLLVLNASHNSINHFEEDSFRMFPNLEKLDLSFNSIEKLPNDVFMSMSDLRFLDLSNNKLISLPNKLPMTEWFDVSNNRISSIPETYSSVLYPQTVFLLGKNPFRCTCDLLWLKDLLSTRKYLLNFVINLDPKKFIPVCTSPEHLAGKPWDTVEDSEFKCIGLDENSFDSANEKASNKIQEEVKVTVSEIGPNWVILKWNGNSDDIGKVIEIKYHKFGENNDKKQVILPLSASGYRLRNLEVDAPYVICSTVMLGADSYSPGCEEIVTAKGPDKNLFSYMYEFVIRLFIDYSNHLIVLLILFITTLYIIQRKEVNKKDKM